MVETRERDDNSATTGFMIQTSQDQSKSDFNVGHKNITLCYNNNSIQIHFSLFEFMVLVILIYSV
jgi:hypothetical protein